MTTTQDLYDDSIVTGAFRKRHVRGKRKPIDSNTAREFRNIIYGFYRGRRRDFPWRHTTDPYQILVSEIMLQQTQTKRVIEKFGEFIEAFPTITALAQSSLRNVLMVWQGMGYNRRARHLHELAARVMKSHGGTIPPTPEELIRLPGIGKATAASICAFAFNKPVVFIETNIRAVFIHFFFPTRKNVDDREILPLVEAVLDGKNPRRFYSALMDYGAMLKKRHPNPSRKSAHHHKQPPFEGSRRQLRGLLLRNLLAHPGITVQNLTRLAQRPENEVQSVIDELHKDGLIKRRGKTLRC